MDKEPCTNKVELFAYQSKTPVSGEKSPAAEALTFAADGAVAGAVFGSILGGGKGVVGTLKKTLIGSATVASICFLGAYARLALTRKNGEKHSLR